VSQVAHDVAIIAQHGYIPESFIFHQSQGFTDRIFGLDSLG
jgi:hypothetical protein